MEYYIHERTFRTIKEMPQEQKPREKIREFGAACLSDSELLTALLGTGCSGVPVQDLSEMILSYLAVNDRREINFDELIQIKGMGPAQTSVICAAIEFGRRMQKPVKLRYATAKAIFEHIKHYGDRPQEHLLCIMFNGALEIIGTKVITVGLVNKTMVHPREVFAEAISARATAIVIAHNHPSGNLEPSPDDLAVTQAIINAGKLLCIQVLDHIIFSDSSYYSMNEHGDVWFS